MTQRRWNQVGVALAISLCGALLAAVPATAGVPPTAEPDPEAAWLPKAPVRLEIATKGAAPIVSRDDYVKGTMVFEGVTRPLEIRGRGNSTWQWAKKPYKLKLGKPAALVGSVKQEEWVLLANFADRSALRSAAAFAVASRTRLAWTPRSRFVDVVLNGQSLGLYLLTEQVEQNAGRVELPDGAYLLEINERYARDGDPGFRSRRGISVSFKDPDEPTRRQRHQVRRGVRNFEDVLYGQGFADPERGYRAYVDVGSFVDWYLVEELFRNQDSNFRSSVNVAWTPGGRFALGPVWDFDLSAGTKWRGTTTPQGWLTRTGEHWLARMLEDPYFSTRVERRWAELRPVVDEVVAQIPAAAEPLRASAEADWALWHAGGEQVLGSRHADSFQGEVTFLRDWLALRAAWLSLPEVSLGPVPARVKERPGIVYVPVRLLSPSNAPVRVDYDWLPGTATRDVDFSMPEGSLVFPPGETLRYVPVTLAADAVPESRETIGIRLRGTDDGAVVGTPAVLTLTIGVSDQPVDALIRRSRDATFVGDDVLNETGQGQTIVSRARPGSRRAYVVRVVNDGTVRNTVRVRGIARGDGVRVRFVRGGDGVTRKLTGRTGWRVRLDPGEHRQLKMIVTVRRGADGGTRARALVRAVWRGDEPRIDVVGARLRVRR